MLKIRVHHDDRIAARVFQTGGQSRLMAKISAEGKETHSFVLNPNLSDYRQRPILRAVVHVKNFRVVILLDLTKNGSQLAMEEGQDLLFLVGRTNDTDSWAVAAHRLAPSADSRE